MMKNDVIRFNAIIGKELAKHIPNKYLEGTNWENVIGKLKDISPEEYKKQMDCTFNSNEEK